MCINILLCWQFFCKVAGTIFSFSHPHIISKCAYKYNVSLYFYWLTLSFRSKFLVKLFFLGPISLLSGLKCFKINVRLKTVILYNFSKHLLRYLKSSIRLYFLVIIIVYAKLTETLLVIYLKASSSKTDIYFYYINFQVMNAFKLNLKLESAQNKFQTSLIV